MPDPEARKELSRGVRHLVTIDDLHSRRGASAHRRCQTPSGVRRGGHGVRARRRHSLQVSLVRAFASAPHLVQVRTPLLLPSNSRQGRTRYSRSVGFPWAPNTCTAGGDPVDSRRTNVLPASAPNVPRKLHGAPPVVPSKTQPPRSGRTWLHAGSVGQVNSCQLYRFGLSSTVPSAFMATNGCGAAPTNVPSKMQYCGPRWQASESDEMAIASGKERRTTRRSCSPTPGRSSSERRPVRTWRPRHREG